MPNTRMLFAAISAALPSSVPVALARSRTAGIAAFISSALKPIRPREVIPSATCLAVKEVSLPSFSATSVIAWNSAPVAPDTARAVLIWSSKSAKVFAAIAEKPDAVTNGMLQEKIDGEAAGLNKRLDGLDAKLDILLNVATNAAPRDLRN